MRRRVRTGSPPLRRPLGGFESPNCMATAKLDLTAWIEVRALPRLSVARDRPSGEHESRLGLPSNRTPRNFSRNPQIPLYADRPPLSVFSLARDCAHACWADDVGPGRLRVSARGCAARFATAPPPRMAAKETNGARCLSGAAH